MLPQDHLWPFGGEVMDHIWSYVVYPCGSLNKCVNIRREGSVEHFCYLMLSNEEYFLYNGVIGHLN